MTRGIVTRTRRWLLSLMLHAMIRGTLTETGAGYRGCRVRWQSFRKCGKVLTGLGSWEYHA